MTSAGPPPIADLTRSPGQGAAGLVLVRLGEQRLRHHHGGRPVRAVPDRGRRGRRRVDDRTGARAVGRSGLARRRSSSPPRRSSRRVLLPLVGAVADRSAHKKRLLAGFAWAGCLAAALMFFVTGDNWQLGAVASSSPTSASAPRWSSTTRSCSRSPTRTSATGSPRRAGRSGTSAAACCCRQLRRWSASTTRSGSPSDGGADQPAVGRRSGGPPSRSSRSAACATTRSRPRKWSEGSLLSRSFGQLWATLRDIRDYPMALTFLVAYLFFNDGIQTVIDSASTYGAKELGFSTGPCWRRSCWSSSWLSGARSASAVRPRGTARSASSWAGFWAGWCIVTAALFLPEGENVPFLLLGVAIGIVLGGTQALSRSSSRCSSPAARRPSTSASTTRGARHVVARAR